MNHLLAVMDGALAKLEWVGIALAAIAFAAMMSVTVIDVFGRYALNAPLTWSFDLMTGYLLVAGFFLAISAAQASRQHISIDLFARMMPRRLRAALLMPAFALAVVFIVIVAWSAGIALVEAWRGNLVMDGIIPWPSWPTHLLVAFGAGLLALRLGTDCLTLAFIATGGDADRDPFAHEHVAGSE